MAEQKKEKQQYLVNEIMDPGYDPDQFVTYMQDQREGGTVGTLTQVTTSQTGVFPHSRKLCRSSSLNTNQ